MKRHFGDEKWKEITDMMKDLLVSDSPKNYYLVGDGCTGKSTVLEVVRVLLDGNCTSTNRPEDLHPRDRIIVNDEMSAERIRKFLPLLSRIPISVRHIGTHRQNITMAVAGCSELDSQLRRRFKVIRFDKSIGKPDFELFNGIMSLDYRKIIKFIYR